MTAAPVAVAKFIYDRLDKLAALRREAGALRLESAEYLRGRRDRLAGKPVMDHGLPHVHADEELEGRATDAYLAGYDPFAEVGGCNPGMEAEQQRVVQLLALRTGVAPLQRSEIRNLQCGCLVTPALSLTGETHLTKAGNR